MAPNEDSFRLHTAACNGKCNLIKQYLAAGDGIDALDGKKKMTPLAVAVMAQQIPAVQLLLAKGANLSVCDENGLSPLFMAVALQNIELATLLVQAGADANVLSNLRGIRATPVYLAASKDDKKMVQLLIDAGCDVNRRLPDPDADPLLIETIKNGHTDILDILLAAGADVNARDCNGLSGLHIAAEKGSLALIKKLLKNGARVDICDVDGDRALHTAVARGHDDITQVLLQAGANPNAREKVNLRTPLHVSAIKGHHKCAYALLCAKADVKARDLDNYYTPLLHASEAGHTEVIEVLLAGGSDLCALDSSDRSSLVLASCIKGHVKAVELLLDAGADPNRLDTCGRNVIFGVSSLEVLKLLLRRGASAKFISIAGETTLHFAGHRGVDAGVLCALYKAGVDPTLKDRCGKTAADVAREKGHEDAAKMIDLLIAKHQSLA